MLPMSMQQKNCPKSQITCTETQKNYVALCVYMMIGGTTTWVAIQRETMCASQAATSERQYKSEQCLPYGERGEALAEPGVEDATALVLALGGWDR